MYRNNYAKNANCESYAREPVHDQCHIFRMTKRKYTYIRDHESFYDIATQWRYQSHKSDGICRKHIELHPKDI